MTRAAAVLLMLAGLWSAAALAAPAKKAEEDRATAAAREHVAKAKVHFKLQEWERAIAEWKEAYRLKPLPALLFNIGQASRLAGQYVESRRYYAHYLRDQPDAPNRDEVRTQLSQLDDLIAKDSTPRPEPATTTASAEPPAPTVPAAALEPVPPAPAPIARSNSVVGRTLAGVAGALAVAGGVTYGLARSGYADAVSVERPRAEIDALVSGADGKYHAALGLGAAALLAGVGAVFTW